MNDNDIILRAEKLRKEYLLGGENTVCIIPGLDIEIEKGEFLVVMGNSGSGKSTLLYLLSGLEEFTGGQVFYKGKQIPRLQIEKAQLRRTFMGFVFQQHNLISSLTLLENILVSGYLVKGNRKQVNERAKKLMSELGIEKLQDRYPAQVSGGEQQRCSIARALINTPDILLADEPTGSLNAASSLNVLQTFSELNRNGQTIIMVTHSTEAACYGKKIIYLRDGEIVDELKINRDRTKESRERELLNWLTEKGW
jgi:putative ABC transport system ATP-binding protein